MAELFKNGVHYLSGIGEVTLPKGEYGYDDINGYIFIIDDVAYLAYEDPDDGYRSYGSIDVASSECVMKAMMYTFEPQKVVTEWKHEEEIDETGYQFKILDYLIVKDAILNKEVLRVGTDYSEDYYPMAIFDYQPMNLYENVRRSIENN